MFTYNDVDEMLELELCSERLEFEQFNHQTVSMHETIIKVFGVLDMSLLRM